jgi:hypothetical protein
MIIPLAAYDTIDRDLCGSHCCNQLVGKSNLPLIPVKVGLTLARVKDINIIVTTIVTLRILLLVHCHLHFLFDPHLEFGLHPESIIISNAVKKSLESF